MENKKANNSLTPPEVIIKPSNPKYLDENRKWQGIPSIEITKKGTLWTIFYSGGTKEGKENYVLLVRSDDKGKTWSNIQIAIEHTNEEIRTFDPCLWIDPQDNMWITWSQNDGTKQNKLTIWGIKTLNPDDMSPTWSDPVRIANGIMINKPTFLSTGEWLLPCAVWVKEHSPNATDEEYIKEMHSNVYSSIDNGKTFKLKGSADVPNRHYDEHKVIEKNDGSLWMLVRTHYGIGESYSYDMGKTWTPGKPTTLGGPSSRFHISRLASGNLLLVNHYGFHDRNCLTAMISKDDGITWEGYLTIDERNSVSYPNATQDTNGIIYIVYDKARGSVDGREILMAKLTEEDILAGKCITDKAQLKHIVNKAGEVVVLPEVIINPSNPKYLDENRQWQGIPSIQITKKGTLWAVFYSGGTRECKDNYVLLVRSDDKGKTWSNIKMAIEHPNDEIRTFDPCVWIDPQDNMWITWSQNDGTQQNKIAVLGIKTSNPDDPSPTWSNPVKIANGVMMNKPSFLSTGEWLLPCAVWRKKFSSTATDQDYIKEMYSNVYSSTDNGKTFILKGGADVPYRQYDEHKVIEKNDGSLWMLVRTYYGIGESYSYDMGKTWTPGKPSTLGGPSSRFHISRLASGNLLLVNHYGFRKRSNLTAIISKDDGNTWEGYLTIDERPSVSYPNATQDIDGNIYIIYDRQRGGEGAKEILMATLTEKDILAGKCISEIAELKRIVNKAGVK